MSAKTNVKKLILPLLLILTMGVLIWGIGYETPRENFVLFISQYLALFAAFYVFWLNRQEWKFYQFFLVAIGLRLVLLFASPELSNDFYRFIWDGELMTQGINPFAHKPNELISNPDFMGNQYMRILFHGMGELSQEHYTCYPVLNQFLFFVPAAISDNIMVNVILLKVIIILADIGAIYYAKKIAEHLKVNTHNIWLYALNPFVILEFSGNLHFEGVMIFFLLGATYMIMKNNWLWGAVLFGCAVQIKLIPLMLIPFFYKKLRWKNALGFTAMTGFVVLALGGLMLNQQFFSNMMESVNEYFVRFQFNSSFYNLSVNYLFAEDNWSRYSIAGQILSVLSTCGILTLALLKAYRNDLDIIKGMLFAFMIYYSMATTVHPWYIGLILVLSVFTQYKFGLIWSIVIMLSYFAYSNPEFAHDPVLITAEYTLVYGILLVEIRRYWRKDAIGIQLKRFFGLDSTGSPQADSTGSPQADSTSSSEIDSPVKKES